MSGAERTAATRTGGDQYATLVDAAQHGDDIALAELVRLTQPAVWRLCRALIDAADVDDLTQEVFLRAVKNLATFRFDAPFMPWLLTIARRVCADHVRRNERRRRLVRRLSGETRDELAHADTSDIHALIIRLK